jgi:hypothetical protein
LRKKLLHQLAPEGAFAVHLLDVRTDFFLGELARRGLEHALFFAEQREGRMRNQTAGRIFGHGCSPILG